MEKPTPIEWRAPNAAHPIPVVQFIPMDLNGRMLVLTRSDTVRSARNCRSFPSGLHDIGTTQMEMIRIEAREELSLEVKAAELFGVYENIAGDDPSQTQFHWVISMFFALVYDVREFVNNEPDKHSNVTIECIDVLDDPMWYEEIPFHESFMDFARANMSGLGLEARVFLKKAEIRAITNVQ